MFAQQLSIVPLWPAPNKIKAFVTTRQLGNVAYHVNDCEKKVANNRARLKEHLKLKHEPAWLEQTHSNNIVCIDTLPKMTPKADGAYTKAINHPCIVMSGDCLPLLLCHKDFAEGVAVLHCGWRSLSKGIIENALVKMRQLSPSPIIAWLGPAISQKVYEVGDLVRDAFVTNNKKFEQAFKLKYSSNEQKYYADLYLIAKIILKQLGVAEVYGGDCCTYTQSEKFYSYRKDKNTGRMATVIWKE